MFLSITSKKLKMQEFTLTMIRSFKTQSELHGKKTLEIWTQKLMFLSKTFHLALTSKPLTAISLNSELSLPLKFHMMKLKKVKVTVMFNLNKKNLPKNVLLPENQPMMLTLKLSKSTIKIFLFADLLERRKEMIQEKIFILKTYQITLAKKLWRIN